MCRRGDDYRREEKEARLGRDINWAAEQLQGLGSPMRAAEAGIINPSETSQIRARGQDLCTSSHPADQLLDTGCPEKGQLSPAETTPREGRQLRSIHQQDSQKLGEHVLLC